MTVHEEETHRRRRVFHLAKGMVLKIENSVNASYPERPRLLPVVMKNCDPFVFFPASKERPLGFIRRLVVLLTSHREQPGSRVLILEVLICVACHY